MKKDTNEPLEKEGSPVVIEQKPIDFYVENTGSHCSIFNRTGERVYSTTGKLKIFHGKIYRFNYKEICFTVKEIKRTVDGWDKGTKKLVAFSDSDLYPLLDKYNFINQIEDFIEVDQMQFNKMSVDGKWYSFDGDYLGVNTSAAKFIETQNDHNKEISPILSDNYVPKGKLKDIGEIVKSSYDYLWLLAIIDLMGEKQCSLSPSYDELACLMIANAWELLAQNPSLKDKETKQYISESPGAIGGHKKLKIYGRLDCPSANRYVAKGQYVRHRVFFDSVDTAVAAGFRPCGTCMPEAYKKWKEVNKK